MDCYAKCRNARLACGPINLWTISGLMNIIASGKKTAPNGVTNVLTGF